MPSLSSTYCQPSLFYGHIAIQRYPLPYDFQAYHVTDSALSYFSPKQTGTMSVLRLQSCWEVTNHGLVNIGDISSTSSVFS